MVSKKSSLLIAAIATLFCIISVAWFSCNKSGGLVRCEGVICENGGYCNYDTATKKPSCICPTGYEGANCATSSIGKYLGTWTMRQIITGSDSASYIGDTSYYTVFLVKTATPTTFFINNFANNPYYNQIICTLDSTNSFNFIIDTLSSSSMLFTSFKITYGSGAISVNDSVITGVFGFRGLTATTNWILDTVSIRLTPY